MSCLKKIQTYDEICSNENGLIVETYFGSFTFIKDKKWRPKMFIKHLKSYVLSEFYEKSQEYIIRDQLFTRLSTFINNPEYRLKAINLAFSIIHFDFEDYLDYGQDFVLPMSFFNWCTNFDSSFNFKSPITYGQFLVYNLKYNYGSTKVEDFKLLIGDSPYISKMLQLAGDIESNPGPVFSKPTFNRECTINVGTESFSDWVNLPTFFSSLTSNFATFVEKLPDKNDITSFALQLFSRMEQISSSIVDSTSNFSSIMEKGFNIMKEMVTKSLVVLIFMIFKSALAANGCINVIGKFLFKYCNFTPIIYKMKDLIFKDSSRVSTEGCVDDFFDLDPKTYLPIAGTAIFVLLFTTMFKKDVAKHDMKSVFSDAFIMNRGIDSFAGLFDKAFSIWDMITNRLLQQQIGMEFPLNKYEASIKVNKFMADLKKIFDRDFDLLDFDDKKQYRRDVSDLHKQSIDILVAVDSMERKRQAGIRQMITLLNQKYSQVISQPLTGKMRLPMYPLLLAGGSGVGKTRLLPILQAISAKVIEKELGVPVSQENVVALNMEADHADGYLGQYIVFCNDVFKKKNSETNPNNELDFFMSAIDQAPYPLKMANLAEKGMFFTSLVGLISTNVVDIKQYAETSQSYTSAICTRLKNNYKVTVIPCYRKFISPKDKRLLVQDQKHFQHSVDPIRARYKIFTEKFAECGIREINHENLLDTYTDAEFERMPKELLKNLPENAINTFVYKFRRYRLDPFEECGPWITFTDFATEYAESLSRHIKSGSITLKEQTTFYNLSLEDMLLGTKLQMDDTLLVDRVPTEGMYSNFIDWMWPNPERNECTEVEIFHDCEGPVNYEFEECIKAFLSAFAAYTCWRDFSELDDVAYTTFRHGVNRFGDDFLHEALHRAKDMMDRRNQYFERETLLHGTFTAKYEIIKNKFLQSKTFVLFKQIGIILSGVIMVYGANKLLTSFIDSKVENSNPNALQVKNIVVDRIAKRTWLEWFSDLIKGRLNTIKLTDITDIELSYSDLVTLYEMYGVVVTSETSSPGGKTQQRHRLLRLRVPTQVAMELVENIRNVHLIDEGVEFEENKINTVMVQTEALMSQLTETMVDHIIPASQWYMSCGDYGIGNATFLDAEHILVPYHYTETLNSLRNQKKINDNTRVQFQRGHTLREKIHGSNINKEIITEVRFLNNFKRIESGLPSNPDKKFQKDAVIITLPSKYRSGTTCRDIKSKFIRRKEMSRLSAIQCQGNMFNWRMHEGQIFDNNTTLTDITPINIIKEYEAMALTEVQPHTFEDGTKGEISIILTARYEYSINSRKGDCGSLLYISDNQLPNGIAGIHVSKAMTAGKSCSVPICYEDILETLETKVETLGLIPLVELSKEDLYAPDRVAPEYPYEVQGKIIDEKYTVYQPTKSSWRHSPLGEHLEDLKFKYKGKGKDYNIQFHMDTAVLRPFVSNSIEYSVKNGKIYKGNIKLNEEQWNDFNESGAKFISPMLQGLKKAQREVPYFNPILMSRITEFLIKKLASGGKAGYCDLSKYLSSITNTEMSSYNKEREYLDELVTRMMKFCSHDSVEKYFNNKIDLNFNNMKDVCDTVVEPCEKYGKLSVYYLDLAKEMRKSDFIAAWPALTSMMFSQANFVNKPVKKIFDIRTAIKGIDGNRACKSMNAKSSPGYGGLLNGGIPYMNRGFPFGKKCWFGEDYMLDDTKVDITVNGKVVCTKEQVRENFEGLNRDVEKILEIAKVERPPVIFVASLKDEKRAFEKCMQGKTRVFFQCDMSTCIASKMLCGPIWSWYILNNIENQLCIGINPYGIDWERIAEKVTRFGDKCIVAGDYAAFDQSQGMQNMIYVDAIDEGVAIRGDITDEEQLNQMRHLQNGISKKRIIANNIEVTIDQIVESGGPKTCIKDCLLNLINMYYLFCLLFDNCGTMNDELLLKINIALGIVADFQAFKLTEEFQLLPNLTKKHIEIVNTIPIPKVSLMDSADYVEIQVCGDDHLLAVAKELQPWFNQRTISALMKIIGMDYTDETKTGVMPPDLRTIEEVTFLKRKFKKFNNHERKWIAPLDIDVVKEIPLWRTNNQSIEAPEALYDNMKTALREMALHGRTEYNDMKKFFEFSWSELYPKKEVHFELYEASLYETLNSESDLEF